jgi:16S rRNA U1498 N3-methylase RsmE
MMQKFQESWSTFFAVLTTHSLSRLQEQLVRKTRNFERMQKEAKASQEQSERFKNEKVQSEEYLIRRVSEHQSCKLSFSAEHGFKKAQGHSWSPRHTESM